MQEVLHDTRMEQLVEKTALPTWIDDTIQLDNGIGCLLFLSQIIQYLLVASTRLYLPRSRGHMRALPVLLYVYGGPGWQTIDDRFSVGWSPQYLSTNLGIAVLQVERTPVE